MSGRAVGNRRPALAMDGGPPAVREPLPPMCPGAWRVGEEEEAAVLAALRDRSALRQLGPRRPAPRGTALARAFGRRVEVRHALPVSSGTSALYCALAAFGIGPGDEVIVPAYTWISTATAVVAHGATPVLAEIDDSLTLDPADAAAKVSPRTAALVAVHMRGAPCRMDALREAAGRRRILEDAAQAVGGSFGGRPLGSLGDAGAFSFQTAKIITSYEGGMVTTGDGGLYRRARAAHHAVGGALAGLPPQRWPPALNHRMSELHAALALVQLGRLDGILADMRERHRVLRERLAEDFERHGVRLRAATDAAGDTGAALVFLLPAGADATRVEEALRAEGVDGGLLHHPRRPDPHVYSWWSSEIRGSQQCPRTLALLGRAVEVHVSPDLSRAQVEQVADGVRKVLRALL